MSGRILILCLLYETITIASTGAVTLPFTDLVATVKPIKPKPLSESLTVRLPPAIKLPSAVKSPPTVPRVPSSDAILAYYKSKFLETDTSEIKCEFSSPLVLTSTSRPAPVPKIEGLNDEVKVKKALTDQANSFKLLPIVEPLSETLKSNLKRESNLPSDLTLPYSFSPTLKLSSSFILPIVAKTGPNMCPMYINDYSSFPLVSTSSIANPSSMYYPESSNTVMPLPSVSSLPIVSIDPSRRTSDNFVAIPKYCLSSIPTYSRSYSPSSAGQLTVPIYSPFNTMSYSTMASMNPLYSLPYPLRYNVLSLPTVVTPSNIPNMRPMYSDRQYTNMGASNASPFYLENPYTSQVIPKMSTSSVSNPNVPKSSLEYPQYNNCVPSSLLANAVKPIPVIDSILSTPTEVPLTSIKKEIPNLPNSICSSTPSYQDVSCPESDPFDFPAPNFDFDFIDNFDTNVEYNDFTIPNIFGEVNTFINEVDCANEYNIDDDFINFQEIVNVYPNDLVFTDCTPCFEPIEDVKTDIVPEISILPLESEKFCSNTPENIPVPRQVAPSPDIPKTCLISAAYTPKLPQISAPTYINVSPTYPLSKSTSNAVSSVNNVVSDFSKNIISSFMSYLSSVPLGQLIRSKNPYMTPQRKAKPVYVPTKMYPTARLVNKPTVPVISQKPSIPSVSSINTSPGPTKVSLDPPTSLPMPVSSTSSVVTMSPFVDDFASSSYITYPPVVDIMSGQITDTPTFVPVKVTMLPPASFTDYSSFPPCPSDLPSPIIPSYIDFSSFQDPQFIKLSNFGKNTKTIEKLLEMVFLTELINGDTYVDWDALDTVLKILSAD